MIEAISPPAPGSIPIHVPSTEDRTRIVLQWAARYRNTLPKAPLCGWYSAMKLLSVPMRYSTCENENRPIMQGITDTPCKRS